MFTNELDSSIKKVREYLQNGQFEDAETVLDAIVIKWPDELEVLGRTWPNSRLD